MSGSKTKSYKLIIPQSSLNWLGAAGRISIHKGAITFSNSTTPMKTFPSLLIAAVCLGSAASPQAGAVMIVAPNSAAPAEGGSNNVFPFDIGEDIFEVPGQTQRYQQVYNATQFAILNLTGGLITEIRFRPDAGDGGAFSRTLPSIRIDLSTTSAAENTLSATFASNVGANNVSVFGGVTGGALALSSAFTGPAVGPKAFDIVITLTTPFFYNPAFGNLLMDVRNFGGGITDNFDAVSASGDGVSRVTTMASGVNSTTADLTDSLGLVTAFTVVPVPEPSIFVMLTFGAAALLTRHRPSGAGV
ncbi:MAG: hypothetical protein ABIZ56_00385 [Chthoniobacteraceae bacterium]